MVENRELNIKNIDAIYDLFDKACMKLVEKGNKKNYLDAFVAFSKFLNDDELDTKGIDNRTINSLRKIIDDIYNIECLNEEVREALMLIIIKGLKHSNMPLDYITPDIIVYLYSHIINSLYGDGDITILDVNSECGVLANGIINNLENDIEYIGLNSDEKLSEVFSALSNDCMNEVSIYYSDCINKDINFSSNVTIINNYDKTKEAILKYSSLSEYIIALIDNDFFTKEENQTFKNDFKGTMLGLIVLPSEMFKEGKEKSILICSNKFLNKFDCSIIKLPSLNDSERLSKVITQMNNWLSNISFKNIYNDSDL